MKVSTLFVDELRDYSLSVTQCALAFLGLIWGVISVCKCTPTLDPKKPVPLIRNRQVLRVSTKLVP